MKKLLLSLFQNNRQPEYINEYIKKLIKQKHQSVKSCKTKYGEWVVVSRNGENDRYINIWISTFKRNKIHKMMPMYLKISVNQSSVKILDIKVLGEDKSKGYGSIFMDVLFEIINYRKLNKITGLAERPEDPRLVAFYKKYGILIVGSQLKWERVQEEKF